MFKSSKHPCSKENTSNTSNLCQWEKMKIGDNFHFTWLLCKRTYHGLQAYNKRRKNATMKIMLKTLGGWFIGIIHI
jgi:hypothetical protein